MIYGHILMILLDYVLIIHCMMRNTNTYILDYEYFDISEMVYYHDNFLDPDLEKIYYFDLLPGI
jgi:hypothetical protein